ncbi:IclR family transcriptional regulator [Nocardiopsis sp. MG754419]|uniref:IclR family transcriptional regulator n=1 Tax=Nocardiopsis sp. MG754419 TaxID=2259865 RepID=UPI001BAC6E31|nr:helix-turn-helix domain-containing protein [Nocardiopsis sp. MG754419]MBR8742682.1 IclR family transcriptional regulator [Nocardiopsis sp. MG754419]
MSPASEDRPDTKTSKTLHNGIEVLELLSRHPHGLTVSEIAQGVGVHRTVAHRLIRTLEEHRLCARDRSKRVTLGPGLVALAESVEADLRAVAGPVLAELAEAQGATAHLVVPEGESEARALMVVAPRGAHTHIAFRAGRVDPVDQGSAGLALLSAMPPRDDERDEVTRARSCGYAVSHGEVTHAVTGISAPVVGRRATPVAAVGLSVLELRDTEAIGRAVAEAARRLAALLPLS